MPEEIKLLLPGKREAEKGRVPTGVIVGLGAAGAAAIGLGLWLLTRKPKEPEPPEAGMANLYGVVIDAQTKKAIPGAMVTLADVVVYTDSSGAYIHEDITPGNYTISFDAEGYETKRLSVYLAEGNNELGIQLIPVGLEAEFHCGVWDSVSQGAVVNALVRLDGPETREQRVNEYGDAPFYDLPAGDYTVTISMTDYQTLQEAISIPAGRTEMEFYLVYEPPSGMEGIDVHWIDLDASVFADTEFDIRAQCENISGAEGDFIIVCTINGLTFYSPSIHIDFPGWKMAYITAVVDTPGEYNVCVGGACQPLTVQEVIAGVFCCPLCGDLSFDDTEALADHMGHCINIITRGAVPNPCYYFDIYCPVCGTYRADYIHEVYYCKVWGARYKTEVPALMKHIIADHGIEALYCENVPEGGYTAGPYG